MWHDFVLLRVCVSPTVLDTAFHGALFAEVLSSICRVISIVPEILNSLHVRNILLDAAVCMLAVGFLRCAVNSSSCNASLNELTAVWLVCPS